MGGSIVFYSRSRHDRKLKQATSRRNSPWNSRKMPSKCGAVSSFWIIIVLLSISSTTNNSKISWLVVNVTFFSAKKEGAINMSHVRSQNTYFVLVFSTNLCPDGLKYQRHLWTNKLEHWYVRHNNFYCLHLWATRFNLCKQQTLLCLTYQYSNLLVLSKHIVMNSITSLN